MDDPGKIPGGRVTSVKPWRQVRISLVRKAGGTIGRGMESEVWESMVCQATGLFSWNIAGGGEGSGDENGGSNSVIKRWVALMSRLNCPLKVTGQEHEKRQAPGFPTPPAALLGERDWGEQADFCMGCCH